jgi:hypothetical protein
MKLLQDCDKTLSPLSPVQRAPKRGENSGRRPLAPDGGFLTFDREYLALRTILLFRYRLPSLLA